MTFAYQIKAPLRNCWRGLCCAISAPPLGGSGALLFKPAYHIFGAHPLVELLVGKVT